MEVEFLGVRGSMPVSGDDTNKYGGHTLCACLVTTDRDWIIIDAGTGIWKLGDIFANPGNEMPQNLHLLLTHFHLDHITGLPFFAPLYSPETTLNFYSAYETRETEECINGLMAGRYFPLEFKATPSKKIFKQIPDNDFMIGGANISYCPLNHPQNSVSYRIQEKGKAIVFATDTEHPEEGTDQKLATFAQGANILVYDAMFTPDEYELGRKGWGHSTWLEGTQIAKEAKVQTLFLSHFNPNHSDKQIDEIISLAREKFPQTHGAREGHKEVL